MAHVPAPAGTWSPSPEQRRQAALNFDRGNQLVATGTPDAGVRLLLECCRLDPANLLYRHALRRAQKTGFGNRRPGWLTWLRAWPLRARLRVARRAGRYLQMLRIGERILCRNPWNVTVQLEMAGAAENLDLLDLAVWSLEQARHVEPNDPTVNRHLARLYERRGNFTQSFDLWEMVRKVAPDDEEAVRKLAGSPPAPPPTASDPLQRESEQLRARLAEDPTRAATYRDLARFYRRAGLLEQAHAVLLDGLAATFNAFELTVELAELQIEPFRRDLAHAEQKLAVHAADDLRKIQSDLLREINTRELDLFRLLADRYPGRTEYRYEAGVRLLRAGRLDEAMTTLTEAQTDPAFRARALVALGQCRRSRNDPRRALVCFEEALQALPSDSGGQRLEAIYELARCHADLGEWPRAVDLACDLVRLDPAHGDIARLLGDWQSRAREKV